MTLLHTAALVCIVAIALSSPVRATIISSDDPSLPGGPGNVTIDENPGGLVWLDLGFTSTKSYAEIVADTSPGGAFQDYRLASTAEVAALYASASIAPVNGLEQSSQVFPLMNLWGITQFLNQPFRHLTVFRTSGMELNPIAGHDGFMLVNRLQEVDDADLTPDFASDEAFPYSWALVRAVPEPSTGALVCPAVVVAGGFAAARQRLTQSAANRKR